MAFWCQITENTQKSRNKCIPLGLKLVKIAKNRAISSLLYDLKFAKKGKKLGNKLIFSSPKIRQNS